MTSNAENVSIWWRHHDYFGPGKYHPQVEPRVFLVELSLFRFEPILFLIFQNNLQILSIYHTWFFRKSSKKGMTVTGMWIENIMSLKYEPILFLIFQNKLQILSIYHIWFFRKSSKKKARPLLAYGLKICRIIRAIFYFYQEMILRVINLKRGQGLY